MALGSAQVFQQVDVATDADAAPPVEGQYVRLVEMTVPGADHVSAPGDGGVDDDVVLGVAWDDGRALGGDDLQRRCPQRGAISLDCGAIRLDSGVRQFETLSNSRQGQLLSDNPQNVLRDYEAIRPPLDLGQDRARRTEWAAGGAN